MVQLKRFPTLCFCLTVQCKCADALSYLASKNTTSLQRYAGYSHRPCPTEEGEWSTHMVSIIAEVKKNASKLFRLFLI